MTLPISTKSRSRRIAFSLIPLALVAAGASIGLYYSRATAAPCVPVDRVGVSASSGSNSSDSEASIQALQASSDQLVPPPTGSTGNATKITDTAATLHGGVTPNGEDTQVFFQYGKTANYDIKTTPVDIGSSPDATSASVRIKGLHPGTTYHYSESIETATHLLAGADECFVTAQSSSSPITSTPVPKSTPAIEGPTQLNGQ